MKVWRGSPLASRGGQIRRRLRKIFAIDESIVYSLVADPSGLQRLVNEAARILSVKRLASADRWLAETHSTHGQGMDGAAFKEALAKLGYSQSAFAREHKLGLRTVQNWARVGPPDFVAPLLIALMRQSIRPPETHEWASNEAAAAESARAVDMPLQTLIQRATTAGWSRQVVMAGIMTWLAGQVIGRR